MNSTAQSIAALAIVAAVIAWFAWRNFRKKKVSGCGSEGCSAVSPEVRKLQARLKH